MAVGVEVDDDAGLAGVGGHEVLPSLAPPGADGAVTGHAVAGGADAFDGLHRVGDDARSPYGLARDGHVAVQPRRGAPTDPAAPGPVRR